MENEDILQRVDQILCDEFELEPSMLRPGATLYEDLDLDSLDAVDMVVALEKGFGIKVSNNLDMQKIQTVDDLHRLIISLHETKEKQGDR